MSEENQDYGVDSSTGEVMMSSQQLALLSARDMIVAGDSVRFIHVRNDCSAAGGAFKVGDDTIAKSMDAVLIAARLIPNAALFTKKGTEPKPQDWVQVLFIDDAYGKFKSTLIKTRSISGFSKFIDALQAMNKSPVGVSFSMRFADAEGENDKGEKFKYKYMTFERKETESKYKGLAIETRAKIDIGELDYPAFD